jgi:hypothetical protein
MLQTRGMDTAITTAQLANLFDVNTEDYRRSRPYGLARCVCACLISLRW